MTNSKRIDIVYTWVDGNDEKWLHKKKQFQDTIHSNTEPFATVKGRFRDNNELLFSLRALDRFFPNHGNVFIVTDKQVPNFLNNQAIVVDHTEIMSEIPTFSSKKIESNLYKIKELSEHFIYFNDDVFLGPSFDISDYFKEEKSVVHFEKVLNTNENLSQVNAANLSRNILANRHANYLHHPAAMAHAPRAVVKSHYEEFIEAFNAVYLTAQKEVFRDKTVPLLLGDLFPRWSLHQGLACAADVPQTYLETSDNPEKISDFLTNFDELHYFCINDTSDNADDHHADLTRFSEMLKPLFPTKSRYEN